MNGKRKYIVEEKMCGTCAHYRQHYVIIEGGHFRALWYGHCRAAGARRPRPDEVCAHWSEERRMRIATAGE